MVWTKGQRPSAERQVDENRRRWLEKEGQKNKKCRTDSATAARAAWGGNEIEPMLMCVKERVASKDLGDFSTELVKGNCIG